MVKCAGSSQILPSPSQPSPSLPSPSLATPSLATEQLSLALDAPGTAGDSGSTDTAASVPGARRRRGRGGARNKRHSKARSGDRCAQCGAGVEVPEWLRGRGLSLHYCGPECRRKWSREYPSYEVELTSRSRSRGGNWNVQSLKARERDSFTCRACGVGEEELGNRLDVHHTIPYKHFRSNLEANKLEHLVSVCPACHSQLEAQLRRELPLFASLRSS